MKTLNDQLMALYEECRKAASEHLKKDDYCHMIISVGRTDDHPRYECSIGIGSLSFHAKADSPEGLPVNIASYDQQKIIAEKIAALESQAQKLREKMAQPETVGGAA